MEEEYILQNLFRLLFLKQQHKNSCSREPLQGSWNSDWVLQKPQTPSREQRMLPQTTAVCGEYSDYLLIPRIVMVNIK